MPAHDSPRSSDTHDRPDRAPSVPPDGLARLAARETRIWLLVLLVLIALAVGMALVSAPQSGGVFDQWRILPLGLVFLVCLFGIYVWSKTREMAELRGLVRGLEQRAAHPPDLDQLEKLFEMVQRSQQGYRDLIDTFHDLLFSVSLDGQVLAANRSFADLLGHPFSTLVGRPLDDFLDLPDETGRASALKALPRLLQQR